MASLLGKLAARRYRVLTVWALVGASTSYAVETAKHNRADVAVEERKREQRKKNPELDEYKKNQINRAAIYAIEVEKKLISGIAKTIDYLQKTAVTLPRKSVQRLAVLERLLNLYVEQAVYVANEENRVYDKRWEAWEAGGRKGKAPKLDERQSRKLWERVAQQARVILQEYPRANDADSHLFTQALAVQFLGRDKEAGRLYTELVMKFPNSRVVGDAYFALGDYYFDRTDFRNAIGNYQKAIKYRQSSRYGWSLYKLGWCQYNLGQYETALATWKGVVAFSETPAAQKAALRLKDEAMRDMVLAFAEMRQIEPAIDYYRQHGGGEYIGRFLRLLAGTFADSGQFDQAILALKRFQRVEPNDLEGPAVQKEIIGLTFERYGFKEVWREIDFLEKAYGPNSAWARANARHQKDVLEAQVLVKDQLLYYAKFAHQRAQKSDDSPALYEAAKRGYLIFLKAYPTSKEAAEVKFNLADSEYWSKNHHNAGVLYLEIALAGKEKAVIVDSKGKAVNVHREASQYMRDAFATDFDPEYKQLLKEKPDFSKPRKISDKAKNFIKGCEYYVREYPSDAKAVKACDINVARTYYHSGIRDLSLKYLWLLAKKYPNEKEGSDAVQSLIPLYKDDKKGLQLAVNQLLEIPQYQKGDLGNKLREVKRGARLEALSDLKGGTEKAKAFEDEAKKDPKAQDSDKLAYNAAGEYLNARDIDNAIRMYGYYYSTYPNTPQAKESLLQAAKLRDRRLEMEEAAPLFLAFAGKYEKDKEAPGALSRACQLKLAAETTDATTVCLLFAKKYPDGAVPILQRLIQDAARKRQIDQVVNLVRKNYLGVFKLSPNDQILALHKIVAVAGEQSTAGRQANSDISRIFSSNQSAVSGEALRYGGELVFKQSTREIQAYRAVALVGPTVDHLAASIQKKGTALAQLEKALNRVIQTKDSYWGIAALYEIGEAYLSFAAALEKPPPIKGASIEDVKQQLAGQVGQLKGNAKKFFATAADLVERFTVYNSYTPKVISRFQQLDGREYFDFVDLVLTPDFVGADVIKSVADAM